MIRYCTLCQVELVPGKNTTNKTIQKRMYSCQSCRNTKRREEYSANPEKWRKRNARYRVNWMNKRDIPRTCRRYKLTEEEFLSKLNAQNDTCAICGTVGDKLGLCVDHNHKTGKIRGFLCRMCNVGLGNLQDSVEVLKSAVRYLEEN